MSQHDGLADATNISSLLGLIAEVRQCLPSREQQRLAASDSLPPVTEALSALGFISALQSNPDQLSQFPQATRQHLLQVLHRIVLDWLQREVPQKRGQKAKENYLRQASHDLQWLRSGARMEHLMGRRLTEFEGEHSENE